MAASVEGRSVILLAKDSMYPAHATFYLAHEIAHIMLQHVDTNSVLVDFDRDQLPMYDDEEESQADAFALEILTGPSTSQRFFLRQSLRCQRISASRVGGWPGSRD